MKREKFYYEKEMYEPASEGAKRIASECHPVEVYFEVQSTAGVPDIVLASFDEKVLQERMIQNLSPVTSLPMMATLQFMSEYPEIDSPFATRAISNALGISQGYLSSTILPGLESKGYVEMHKRGWWHLHHRYTPTAALLVTIEVKVKKWKQALFQAKRQGNSSDYAWIIIDDFYAKSAIANREIFEKLGIGLGSLDAGGGLKAISGAPHRSPAKPHRETLAERVLEMKMSSQNSGPAYPVFGRNLAEV
ncbi:hypothetical protein ACFWTE_20345 [Nocardiopsis sp. NPDC058631]|uniref:hypothetical protein n=1 Tax=Nocardiopsis sp. NPDC058631 TaxID=3346566 RepID=UPI0036500464